MIRLLIPVIIFALNIAPYANSVETSTYESVGETNKANRPLFKPRTWIRLSSKTQESIEKTVLPPFKAPSESRPYGLDKSIHFWLSVVSLAQSTPSKPMETPFSCQGYKKEVGYSEKYTRHGCTNEDSATLIHLCSGKTKLDADTHFYPLTLIKSTETDQERSDVDDHSVFTDLKILRQQCPSCFDHENKDKATLGLPGGNGRLTISGTFREMLKNPEDLHSRCSENLLSEKDISKSIDRINISGNVTVKYKQLPKGESCFVKASGFIRDTDLVKVKMTGKHALEVNCPNTISGEPVEITIATNKVNSFTSSGRATATIELHPENKEGLFLYAGGNSSMTVSGPAGKTSITKETPKDIDLRCMTTRKLVCDYRHTKGDIFVNADLTRKPNKPSVMQDKENPRTVILKSADTVKWAPLSRRSKKHIQMAAQ